jgi:hypothetical protein
MCVLQKAWLPALTIVCGLMVAALLLRYLVIRGPGRLRAWRRERARPRSRPAFDDDPVLVAANWGLTYEDAHPRRRSWRRD